MSYNHSYKILILVISFLFLSSHMIVGQSGRETWQPPEKIMDAIGVTPGMIIGEAGAGTGYFTFHLANRVGKNGKVYANDISKSGLDEIQSRIKREDIKNIKTILGEIEDPLFPKKNLDMIIMVYVLHCLEKPLKFMENLKKYMNSKSRLVIIERNTHKERAHYPAFMTKKQILDTIQKTNYSLERIETFLPKDSIYIFKLKE